MICLFPSVFVLQNAFSSVLNLVSFLFGADFVGKEKDFFFFFSSFLFGLVREDV